MLHMGGGFNVWWNGKRVLEWIAMIPLFIQLKPTFV